MRQSARPLKPLKTIARREYHEQKMEPLVQTIDSCIVQAIVAHFQLRERPTLGREAPYGGTAPTSGWKVEEVTRYLDACSPCHGDCSTDNGETAGVLGKLVHSAPIDRRARTFFRVSDHGQICDPDESDEAVEWLTGVRGQNDHFVRERQAVGLSTGTLNGSSPHP